MILWGAIGVALGFAGGALHLAITRWRASLIVGAHASLVVVTMPLALLPIAAAVLLAARVAPVAAWLSPVGILAARALLFASQRRQRP